MTSFNVYVVSPTSYKRLIDVETTSCVQWDTVLTAVTQSRIFIFRETYEVICLLINTLCKVRLNLGQLPISLGMICLLSDLETADLVRFTEEILKGKLHFLCSLSYELSTLQNEEKIASDCQSYYLTYYLDY